MKTTEKNKKLYLILLIAVSLVVLLRIPFGFNQADESFYLALVHRLWMGDKLVTCEWHPCQFYSFALLPFYSLYRLLVPEGHGIIFFFRILTGLLNIFTGFLLYRQLRRNEDISPFFSFAAASTIILFAKSGIPGPSYNNLCVCFSVLAIILHMDKKTVFAPFASGICTAMSVLCMPYLAVPVIIYYVCGLINISILKRRKAEVTIGNFMTSILGIAVSAIIYLLCCFDLKDIPSIMEDFPYIFLDPEHKKGFFYFLHQTWWSMRSFCNEIVLYILLVFCVVFAVFRIIRVSQHAENDSHGRGNKHVLLIICALSLAAAILGIYKGFRNIGYPSIALTVWYIPVFIIAFTEPDLKQKLSLCRYLLVTGLILAFAYAGGSDTRLNAVTVGFTLSACAAFIAVGHIINMTAVSDDISGTFSRRLIYLFLTALLMMMLVQRVMTVAKDSDLANLSSRITEGPAAGLLTTPAHRQQYDEVYSLIRSLDDPTAFVAGGNGGAGAGGLDDDGGAGGDGLDGNGGAAAGGLDGNGGAGAGGLDGDGSSGAGGLDGDGKSNSEQRLIFISRILPWAYLCTEQGCGGPTSWRTGISDELLTSYYERHPDRIPDTVLILNDDIAAYDTCSFTRKKGSDDPNKNELSGTFWDYLNSGAYDMTKTSVGMVFRRNQGSNR